jgi:hypothetical protein
MTRSEKPPLHVQAAKASWLAPVLAIVGTTIAKSRTSAAGWDPSGVILDVLVFVLCLIGVVSGIVALSGLRRHGRAGILAPALAGTVLSAAILTLFASNFVAARVHARDPQRVVEKVAEGLQSGLPKKIDAETELSAVRAGSRELVFEYRLVNVSRSQIDLAAFQAEVAAGLRSKLCSELPMLWEHGLSCRVRYLDAEAVLMADIVVTSKDCS